MKWNCVFRCAPVGLTAAVFVVGAWAAESRPVAPPPKFDDAEVNKIFFNDAREQLVGPRPDNFGAPKVNGPAASTGAPSMPIGIAPATVSDGNAWSSIVSADTLEAEVKSQPPIIDASLKATDPRKTSRMVMTHMAAVFGVVQKYDKDVRWKADAQPWRDTFAKAANNLKAFTDTQKKQVTKTSNDLKELIQGSSPQVSTAYDPAAPWQEIADRPPIMHRLEVSQQERLAGWSKDADSVMRNADAIIREAEIVAMYARIIQDKSYEFGDDDTYLGFARDLETQATEAVAATKRGDGAAASSAISKMQKACDDCHGGYR